MDQNVIDVTGHFFLNLSCNQVTIRQMFDPKRHILLRRSWLILPKGVMIV